MTKQPRCHQHRNSPELPRLCHICQRIAVEQDIVTRTVDAFLAAGYLLQTDLHDDPRPEKPTADRAAILDEVMEVDDEFLGLFHDEDCGPFGWVRFVYGNDGWDVISDYTTNLEGVLAPINAYAEQLDAQRSETTTPVSQLLAEDVAELRTISGPGARQWVLARLNDIGLPTGGTIAQLLRDLFVAAVIGNDKQVLRGTIQAFDALCVDLPADLRAIADKALAAKASPLLLHCMACGREYDEHLVTGAPWRPSGPPATCSAACMSLMEKAPDGGWRRKA